MFAQYLHCLLCAFFDADHNPGEADTNTEKIAHVSKTIFELKDKVIKEIDFWMVKRRNFILEHLPYKLKISLLYKSVETLSLVVW